MTAPPLERYAFPLLPTEAGAGRVVELDSDWSLQRPVDGAVVYGRPPLRSISPLRAAVVHAVRRTRFIRRCKRARPSEVHAIHRLPPPPGTTAPGLDAVRAHLLGGALVLLSAKRPPPSALEETARAAGARSTPSEFHVPGDGGAVARIVTDEGPRILRMARRGEAADPARVGDALELLERAEIARVPRLAGRGVTGDISWIAETVLPGAAPRRVSTPLNAQLIAFCSSLPRADGPPRAAADDLDVVEEHFSERADALALVRERVSDAVAQMPTIVRHGDLWAGNVLADADELTGVVDWAAWHPHGVPGTDLLHLFVAGRKKKARGELGDAWAARPWRQIEFLDWTSTYWRALDVDPTRDVLDGVALAWWAAWVAQSVARHPGRARQTKWVAGNVDRVLDDLDLEQP